MTDFLRFEKVHKTNTFNGRSSGNSSGSSGSSSGGSSSSGCSSCWCRYCCCTLQNIYGCVAASRVRTIWRKKLIVWSRTAQTCKEETKEAETRTASWMPTEVKDNETGRSAKKHERRQMGSWRHAWKNSKPKSETMMMNGSRSSWQRAPKRLWSREERWTKAQ